MQDGGPPGTGLETPELGVIPPLPSFYPPPFIHLLLSNGSVTKNSSVYLFVYLLQHVL